MLPYVPIADRVRIGIAMFSYSGTLTFGITADYHSTPDIDVLADGIGASVRELLEEAARRGDTSGPDGTGDLGDLRVVRDLGDMERPPLHTGD